MKHHRPRLLLHTFAMGATPRRHENYGEPLLLSQDEAAHRLGISRTTLWRLAKADQLEVVHIGSRALITRGSIDDFLTERRAR